MTSLWDQVVPPGATTPSGGAIYVQTGAPPGVKDGDLWYDLTLGIWKERSGGAWVTSNCCGAGGPGLPIATRQGQVLVAGIAPTFTWAADDVDCGRV